MLTVVFAVLSILAVAVAAILFVRLQKQTAAHSQLSREYDEFKSRYQAVLDVEAEKARVLQSLESERARIQSEIAGALDEKQRALGDLEAAKQRVRGEVEAAAQAKGVEMEAERVRLEGIVAQIRVNQQEALEGLHAQRRQGELDIAAFQASIDKLRSEFNALDEEANLQSFGFYKPRYAFADSTRFQQKLDEIRDRQKQMIKNKSAAVCRVEWTVNGSKVEGRKQINQTLKLMLRAFNGECDAAVAKVKYNNIQVMETRIRKAYDAINSMTEIQTCQITWDYLSLKLEELYLAHEYQERLQEEKEEQRRIREQIREEEVAQRELEKAKLDAEKEENRYAEALRKATEDAQRAVGEKQQKLMWQVEELQRRLDEAKTNKERAIARAQMTRSGHVYVISNVGSFGEHVYKIGMTRRLDPMDRVRELGDASVPFSFDVHAIIFSEDAPALENKLHRLFHDRRINLINARKEFFRVTIEELAQAVRDNHGEIDITLAAEAVEYRKTLAMLQTGQENSPVEIVPQSAPVG
jgi:Domain of unknown function (DUF4041)/Meiotically up-regulated gene 113